MRTIGATLLVLISILLPATQAAPAVSIHDIQYTTSPSGTSPYRGLEVTTTGVVTATDQYGFFIADGAGAWNAVYVYTSLASPCVGDLIRVTAWVYEYYGMTELINPSAGELISSGHEVVATTISASAVSQEQYESVLVRVEDVQVAALAGFGEWVVADTSGYAFCDDQNDYAYFPAVGDVLQSVTGVVAFTYGAFKIEPRWTADIAGDPIPHYVLKGHIVTMNESRDVHVNAYLEISGDQIVAIHSRAPQGLPVHPVGGLIFPGLIDSHNHPTYSALDVIPFTALYPERYAWQADPFYWLFSDQYDSVMDYGGEFARWADLFKLAEVRAATAGTTTIQGFNCNGDAHADFAHQGIGIDNAERFPGRVFSSTFPLRQESWYWPYMSSLAWERFAVHLSEGVTPAALEEFYVWKDVLGMLDSRTTIIHGVPYGAPEWQAMAAVGASLVWSPSSNMRLYGATADVPGALAAGVNVALAPDWAPSGTGNLLDELAFATELSRTSWGSAISPQQFVELVTRNAARAMGAEDFIGQIAPGYRANLMVVAGSPVHPYDALLRASPAHVKLTVVSGRPLYGNPDLMSRFTWLTQTESFQIRGEEKTVALAVDAHSIPDSDKPFAQVMQILREAYDASQPKISGFKGLE